MGCLIADHEHAAVGVILPDHDADLHVGVLSHGNGNSSAEIAGGGAFPEVEEPFSTLPQRKGGVVALSNLIHAGEVGAVSIWDICGHNLNHKQECGDNGGQDSKAAAIYCGQRFHIIA